MILVDTGVVVAMGNRRDDDHERCTELLASTLEPLILPEPLLVEIGYMLGSRAGSSAEADFLRDVADGLYTVESMMLADIARAADLVEKYADLPLGTADACVIALAERLGVTRVATLDTRHFSVVKPKHIPAFTLLP
ncbi:type II toxin-antitoxin system VapC family toxin [Amycolatopsis sp. BJA-103]|uniref:type II toxin-antitoxin system VapC family toxin n=1 Tax=Amycolatopsis sp. BJA-103 TaxID=1911175 RepID=UPI000C757A5E|nr:PIN domain-containing protein [Amycolatopsis sp. BJA-103]AUI62500.1 DNA-binding protein [Amycolatopsis sp. BJA-103]PNE18336.1 DNA-binding protein [Amycolatopsis sp. BJA-103]